MKEIKNNSKFKCKWCDSTYGSKLSKSRHQKECKLAPALRNSYQCDRCAYKTTRKDSFDRHEKTCSKKRSKVCTICKKVFNRHTHLKNHMKTHNRPSYKCEKCNHVFKRIDHYEKYLSSEARQIETTGTKTIDMEDPFGANELLAQSQRSLYSMSIHEVIKATYFE